jgi:hypothetical protein
MSSRWPLGAVRIAAWVALEVTIAIAIHYEKRCEAEMVTSLSREIAPLAVQA